MIRFISRKDLDITLYDACVESDESNRVYAFSWYLDAVCDHWSALVLDDFEAVMPLPSSKKLGLPYISQPYFCQQLGIFSSKKLDHKIIDDFLSNIPVKFLKTHLNVNFSRNTESFNSRFNFELDLNRSYDDLYKAYRKDRKKSLRLSGEAGLIYKDYDNREELIQMYQEVFGHLHHDDKLYSTISRIIDKALTYNYGFIRNVFYNDELVSCGFFLKYKDRIYYLFAATNTIGKKYGATTFLIDSVIQENSETNLVFDFEGSSIESIASFYKSFGSKKTTYYSYKNQIGKRLFS